MDMQADMGNPIIKVTRIGGGSYASDYLEYQAAFNATQVNRFDFASTPNPGTSLDFYGHLPGNAWRFEMPLSRVPTSLSFAGGIPPVESTGNITLTKTSSKAAMTANTYFYDASTKTLSVWAAPTYKDYVASNVTVYLEIK